MDFAKGIAVPLALPASAAWFTPAWVVPSPRSAPPGVAPAMARRRRIGPDRSPSARWPRGIAPIRRLSQANPFRSRMIAATSGLPGRRRDFLVQCQPKARGGANGGRCRAELSRDIAANRTTLGTTQLTRAGRTGGGAGDAARSFGKLQVGDEARGFPLVGQHEFENWRLLKRKRRRKESSSW
jgi:hypothetical protein